MNNAALSDTADNALSPVIVPILVAVLDEPVWELPPPSPEPCVSTLVVFVALVLLLFVSSASTP